MPPLVQGSLYPALRQLQSQGLATFRTVKAPAKVGGRDRKIYRLTTKGQQRAGNDRATVAQLIGCTIPPEA